MVFELILCVICGGEIIFVDKGYVGWVFEDVVRVMGVCLVCLVWWDEFESFVCFGWIC